MELKTFPQGIHPADSKGLTKEVPIEAMPTPKVVKIAMRQHMGAPAEPVVNVGDYVKVGQLIGKAGGAFSANIHSSVSGKVIKITEEMLPLGWKSQFVVIESDGKDEWIGLKGTEDYESKTPEELRQMIFDAGIVGLGGATFPTHIKLNPPKEKPIEYLIVNAAECEPYLTCDYRLMIERTMDTIKGMKIVMKILGVDKCYIGIEANKIGAYNAYRKMLENDKNIVPVLLATKYPQGGEKSLIKAILNREVPSGGLPMDVGVVVHNVGTLLAIYEAVVKGKPLIERVVTVSGYSIRQPKNVIVKIGTTFEEVINYCGGFVEEPGKVILGGPMMGFAQYTLDVSVIKGTSGIIAFPKETVNTDEEGPCIKCAKCVDVCPQFLLPTALANNAKKYRWEKAEEFGAMDCVECGSCSYVCPAKINLVQYIKVAKAEIVKRRKKANK